MNGLADVYTTLAYHGVMGREEAIEKSRVAVGKALAIDANLAEALAASAERKYLFEWEWDGAEEDLKRAVELKPGSYHIMLIGLVRPIKEGESIPLSLNFADRPTVVVDAVVKKWGSMPPMSHH